jgi:hypothetical protein
MDYMHYGSTTGSNGQTLVSSTANDVTSPNAVVANGATGIGTNIMLGQTQANENPMYSGQHVNGYYNSQQQYYQQQQQQQPMTVNRQQTAPVQQTTVNMYSTQQPVYNMYGGGGAQTTSGPPQANSQYTQCFNQFSQAPSTAITPSVGVTTTPAAHNPNDYMYGHTQQPYATNPTYNNTNAFQKQQFNSQTMYQDSVAPTASSLSAMGNSNNKPLADNQIQYKAFNTGQSQYQTLDSTQLMQPNTTIMHPSAAQQTTGTPQKYNQNQSLMVGGGNATGKCC